MLLAAGPRFGVDGAFERHLRLPYTVRRDQAETALDRLALAWHDLDRTGRGSGRRPRRGGLTGRRAENVALATLSAHDP